MAIEQCAGQDGAETRHGEHPIDREAGSAAVGSRWEALQERRERLDKLRHSLAGTRRDGHCHGIGQRGAGQQRPSVGLHQSQPVGIVGQIRFGQDKDAAFDAQQPEDGGMLARLRHHAFVGGDHQQDSIHPADPGQHVLDEVAVPGDIDDPDGLALRQSQPGEAKVDRHLTFDFLAQSIGVDAGQGMDERRLAVVNVAGRADDMGPVVRLRHVQRLRRVSPVPRSPSEAHARTSASSSARRPRASASSVESLPSAPFSLSACPAAPPASFSCTRA